MASAPQGAATRPCVARRLLAASPGWRPSRPLNFSVPSCRGGNPCVPEPRAAPVPPSARIRQGGLRAGCRPARSPVCCDRIDAPAARCRRPRLLSSSPPRPSAPPREGGRSVRRRRQQARLGGTPADRGERYRRRHREGTDAALDREARELGADARGGLAGLLTHGRAGRAPPLRSAAPPPWRARRRTRAGAGQVGCQPCAQARRTRESPPRAWSRPSAAARPHPTPDHSGRPRSRSWAPEQGACPPPPSLPLSARARPSSRRCGPGRSGHATPRGSHARSAARPRSGRP